MGKVQDKVALVTGLSSDIRAAVRSGGAFGLTENPRCATVPLFSRIHFCSR